MTTQSKCIIFAVALVATNWHWSRTIQQPNTSTIIDFHGAHIGILVCAVALVAWLVRLYRLVRALLDQRVRVPQDLKFLSWLPNLFLLPLLFSVSSTFTTTISDKETMIISRGYGSGGASFALFVLAALLIGCYQMFYGLISYHQNSSNEAK
jgi:hypothetical protein